RHPVYAQVLRFFLWQARLPKQAQWALLIAPFVIGRVIRTVHNDAIFFPLALVFIGLIVLTWAADPVMTLALLATGEGRLVVSRDSRIPAALFRGFLACAGPAARFGRGEGRPVVSRDSRIAAALFGGFIAVAVAAAIVGAVYDPHLFIV